MNKETDALRLLAGKYRKQIDSLNRLNVWNQLKQLRPDLEPETVESFCYDQDKDKRKKFHNGLIISKVKIFNLIIMKTGKQIEIEPITVEIEPLTTIDESKETILKSFDRLFKGNCAKCNGSGVWLVDANKADPTQEKMTVEKCDECKRFVTDSDAATFVKRSIYKYRKTGR